MKSDFLVGLLRIAKIEPEKRVHVKELIKKDDKMLNDMEGMNCYVWV